MFFSVQCFFFTDTATTALYTYYTPVSLHDAIPISVGQPFADSSAEPGQPFPEGCGPFDPAVHHGLVVPGNRKGNGPRQTGYATRACIQDAIIDPGHGIGRPFEGAHDAGRYQRRQAQPTRHGLAPSFPAYCRDRTSTRLNSRH